MSGREIQGAICNALRVHFDPEQVVSEWSVRRGASDAFGDAATYAPRLDIAVGPFNTTFQNRHTDAVAIHNVRHPVVERLRHAVWDQNQGGIYQNRNPRCLLAIEVENSTSSKHILGGITNASMLGLLGVIIGPATYIQKIRRIHTYACKLKKLEKAHDDMFGNVACLEDGEFLTLLGKYG
jgi:hypothetical protein